MRNLAGYLALFVLLSGCVGEEERLEKKADRLHSSLLTVDTHCDTPMYFEVPGFDLGVRQDEVCVDFPRMKEGGLDAEFFAVFISQGPRNDSVYDIVHKKALGIFKDIRDNVASNSTLAGFASTPDDAVRLKKEGRIAAFTGLENGYPAGKDLGRIWEYYDLGARYITLCHSSNNDICDSSSDPKGPEHNGLSAFGREVVREMNRIGMMIDVSHISDKSFYDVISLSEAPVIASHSSCRALCSSPRNLTDDMLLSLKENGGVIQICILSSYIKTPEPNPALEAKMAELTGKYGEYSSLTDERKADYRVESKKIQEAYKEYATVSDVVDHIDHVVQIIGIGHVGIGTDFDGGGGVEGCMTVAEMKNLTVEMLRRGYTRRDIEKIWGGNLMRVFREVESLREKGA